jgi:hypothetical protein
MDDTTTTSRARVDDTTTGHATSRSDRGATASPASRGDAGAAPPDRSEVGPLTGSEQPDLRRLGLAVGDRVRWRDRRSSRWREGRVIGIERDGSVGVRDARGASRALRIDRLEVRDRGPRGGVVWEPLPERAARTEQLGLWRGDATGAPATDA